MPAELFFVHERKLQFNDALFYRCAVVAHVQNPDAPEQPVERGPYAGKVVDFTEHMVGVRADGWMGEEPLYYLYPDNILSVIPSV